MTLSNLQLSIIKEQEQILEQIQKAVHQSTLERRGVDYQRVGDTIKELRDDAITASDSDLSAIFDQLNTQRALYERTHIEKLPDTRAPYFAYLCLEENGKQKHVLLGYYTYLNVKNFPVIDWRHAPAARIFFNYRQGEEYCEEFPGRIAEGKVIKRVVLTMDNGKLVGIVAGGENFKFIHNEWKLSPAAFQAKFAGGEASADRSIGTGQGGQASAQISALLDKSQYEMLNAPLEDPLLILGGAGCGKTTVALHRMALITYRHKIPTDKMVVIVPETGLVRLTKRLLASLAMSQVAVLTFDRWVEQQARKVLRGLPKRVYPDTSGNIVKFKRHPAIENGIDELIRIQKSTLLEELSRKFPRLFQSEADGSLFGGAYDYSSVKGKCFSHWLHLLEKQVISNASQNMHHDLRTFFKNQKRTLLKPLDDRLELFTNRRILEHIVEASGGELKKSMVDQVIDYSREQFSRTAKDRYRDVDMDNLKTIDGKSLAEQESQSELAGTIDAVDFPILLRLLFKKTQGRGPGLQSFPKYMHMVIDEAQDLSPTELRVLSSSLDPDCAVTIAGDAAQQINTTTAFSSWGDLLNTMGLPEVSAKHLTTTYRCTTQITKFARQVLGAQDNEVGLHAIRDGAPVTHSVLASDAHASIFLADALNDLLNREPMASVAVICKKTATASSIYNAIKDLPKVRMVLDGEFDFSPGVDVTLAGQVKGLEFDYVIVPDASSHIYQDTDEDRRLLHVASTRAIHQLWVVSVVKPSSILGFLND